MPAQPDTGAGPKQPAGLVTAQLPATEPVAAATTPEPQSLTTRRSLSLASIVAATLVAGAVVGFLLRPLVFPATRSDRVAEPATAEIWKPWLQNGSDAVICFSNPLTAVIKHFSKPLPEGTQPVRFRFSPHDEKRMIEAFHLPASTYVYYSAAINQTKVGEAIAGVHLTSLLSRHHVPVRTTQSRFLSWEDLRKENLILMGHSEANQWLEPLLKAYPFRLVATTDEHPRGILNSNPAPGEPAEYKIAYSQSENDADQEYALVSMIPGIDPSKRLLLINGLNAQATQIATEYMTSETSLVQLLDRLRRPLRATRDRGISRPCCGLKFMTKCPYEQTSNPCAFSTA